MIRIAVLSIALAACGTSKLKKANNLLDDVRAYHDGVRWQKLGQAAARLPLAERDAFINEHEELAEELRIGDYELVRVRYAKGTQLRAKVRVQYTWHLDSRGIVHKTWVAEEWERRGKKWILVNQERAHGEPMPGLAEPTDKPADEPSEEPVDEADEPSVAAGASPQ